MQLRNIVPNKFFDLSLCVVMVVEVVVVAVIMVSTYFSIPSLSLSLSLYISIYISVSHFLLCSILALGDPFVPGT